RDPTAATSVLSAGGADWTRPTAAVTPRRPRPGPARSPGTSTVAPYEPQTTRSRRRAVLAALALLLAVLVIVALFFALRPPSTEVRLRNVVFNNVPSSSRALTKLVEENTQ
ncbi:MAG: hypothetical protein ACYCYN_10005, partial [Solirubrobacteraceae bacterium]